MRSTTLLAIAASCSLALAGGAVAAPPAQITTPTRNIGCIGMDIDGSAVLRCDIRVSTFKKPKPPAGCDLDYGDALTLAATGRSRWICHGDTALPPPKGRGFTTIRYGRTWVWGPFSCISRVTALECRNDQGHGFALSRLRVKRF